MHSATCQSPPTSATAAGSPRFVRERNRPRLALAAAAFAAFALTVAGCSSSQAPAAGGQSPTRIEIVATDHRFDPPAATAAAGPIVFSVRNAGAVEHEFEIFKGDRVVDEVEDIAPGITRELKVTLDAGSYAYVCKLLDHEEKGMKGVLTVT